MGKIVRLGCADNSKTVTKFAVSKLASNVRGKLRVGRDEVKDLVHGSRLNLSRQDCYYQD